MSDPRQTVVDVLVEAREQVDTMVNSFAPSSDEEEAEVQSLRDKSEALTMAINETLAKPIPGLVKEMQAQIASLQRASARLLQIELNLVGVKEAIALTDQIL